VKNERMNNEVMKKLRTEEMNNEKYYSAETNFCVTL
jgi:hypothetical protein